MADRDPFPLLEPSPALLVERALRGERRVLLFGQPGVGKSTLAAQLAGELQQAGRACLCIGADPGSPVFGVPGALCAARWRSADWEITDREALCTLDAGRFRLPVTQALGRLAARLPAGVLLIDGPGVVRGAPGAELLLAMVETLGVDTILCMARRVADPPLAAELHALNAQVFLLPAAAQAHRPGKRARARHRTRLWDAYLERADDFRLALRSLSLLGTPPPADVSEAWPGRQVALLDRQHRTLALGEVVGKDTDALVVRAPRVPGEVAALLVRDARRMADGLLGTAQPPHAAAAWYTPPPDLAPPSGRDADTGGPRPVLRVGAGTVTLVNGIFGDPLVHLRLRHAKRSLLFDLGEAGRLAARIAHQVSDVFISHAHFDHIAGFLWLLRSRIGVSDTCRLYGPPGLAHNIQGMIDGIHWDRIGDRGPRFLVTELHGERLSPFRLQAGRTGPEPLAPLESAGGVVLEESSFRVRAVTLDHGTPVLAYAFEPRRTLNIRKERLAALDLPIGPWLGELKRHLHADQPHAPIALPDGRVARAGDLGRDLVIVTPGQALVYATDLADVPDNRRRLIALAHGAHTLFCEAVFVQQDAAQAARTGHLTARACAEIASAAEVRHLVPFHFSRRYEDDPQPVYDELRAACSRVLLPSTRTFTGS